MSKKGSTNHSMKVNRPFKNFCSTNIKKCLGLREPYTSPGNPRVLTGTDCAKLCVPGTFALCPNGLVKLTPRNENLNPALGTHRKLRKIECHNTGFNHLFETLLVTAIFFSSFVKNVFRQMLNDKRVFLFIETINNIHSTLNGLLLPN